MFELFDMKDIDGDRNKSKMETIKKDVMPQLLEMSKIKTRFDAEKFTVGKEGNFLASQFHFLMRQYRFAISEYDRMVTDIEEQKRWIEILKKEDAMRKESDCTDGAYDRDYVKSAGMNNKLDEVEHIDLEVKKAEQRIFDLTMDAKSKLMMINDFEDLRKRLIELNGKEFTAEQYENEQPMYYKWFLANKAVQQLQSKVSGISEGVIEAYNNACRDPIIPGSIMKLDAVVGLVPNGQGGMVPLIDISKITQNALLECDPLIPQEDDNVVLPTQTPFKKLPK